MVKNKEVLKKQFPIKDKDGLLHKKEHWINLIKGHKALTIFMIIVSLIIAGMLIYITYILFSPLFEEILEVLNRNFGKILTSKFFTTLFASLFLSVYLTMILFFVLWGFIGKKANKWFILTLYLILVVGIFGFFALDSVMGNAGLNLLLWGENGTLAGEIKCEGPLGPIIIGDYIDCKTNLNEKDKFNLSEQKIMPVLTIKNEGSIDSPTALPNTTYFGLRVYETTLNGEKEKFTTGTSYSFITKEKFEENRERFLQAFLALMLIILVTIPIAVLNFRKLWRK